jgi:uncharacterized membrane protein
LQLLHSRLGRYLQIMIVFSLLFVVAGLLIVSVKESPHTAALTPIASLGTGIVALDGAAFVTAGLYIILLMPLMILLTSFAHFLSKREKRSVIVCIALIIMLIASYVLILK